MNAAAPFPMANKHGATIETAQSARIVVARSSVRSTIDKLQMNGKLNDNDSFSVSVRELGEPEASCKIIRIWYLCWRDGSVVGALHCDQEYCDGDGVLFAPPP